MTQNDEAWGKIFDRLRLMPEIERHGFVYVSAEDIKKRATSGNPGSLPGRIPGIPDLMFSSRTNCPSFRLRMGNISFSGTIRRRLNYPLEKSLPKSLPRNTSRPRITVDMRASIYGIFLLNHRLSILRILYPC